VPFSPDDTIVAIATPAGRGGIGVVRISGPAAAPIAGALIQRPSPLQPRVATFTRLTNASTTGEASPARAGDEVVVTFFPTPRSYTGQDVVEISAHGSPVVLHGIVRDAVAAGARLARAGEFTLRAFLNAKRDLIQSEAVADLIAAATPLQAQVAFDQLDGTLTRRIAAIDAGLFETIARLEASLDFPDEGYHFIDPRETQRQLHVTIDAIDALLADANRGRLIREGATVVIAGRPNVGKSSLFNRLVGVDRAIVNEAPGTTRDLVSERVDVGGVAVTLVDTAGARETFDAIEREGVDRAARAADVADLVLVVLDATQPLNADDEQLIDRTGEMPRLIVQNKMDRACASPSRRTENALCVSAATGDGLDALRLAIARALTGGEHLRDTAAISNARHIDLLTAAQDDLRRACAAAGEQTPEEFLLTDLQAARSKLDEIVGVRTSEDVLTHIFERFCIGK
jgi:tRNA modification GTPase